MPITQQQLLQILPNARTQVGVFVSALNTAMQQYQIGGPKRAAHTGRRATGLARPERRRGRPSLEPGRPRGSRRLGMATGAWRPLPGGGRSPGLGRHVVRGRRALDPGNRGRDSRDRTGRLSSRQHPGPRLHQPRRRASTILPLYRVVILPLSAVAQVIAATACCETAPPDVQGEQVLDLC